MDVPVQDSEHCVAVAESYVEAFRDDCRQLQTWSCQKHIYALAEIKAIYSDAIIASLLRFGSPSEGRDEAGHTSFSKYDFFDGELMRRLFDKCLAGEKLSLEEKGFQPARYVVEPPALREGQKCVRLRYPEFRIVPLSSS